MTYVNGKYYKSYSSNSISNILPAVIGTILGFVIVFGGIFLIGKTLINYAGSASCESKYGTETEYTILGGCKIKVNGKMLPENLFIKQFEQNINISK